jgi:hypothetical protein
MPGPVSPGARDAAYIDDLNSRYSCLFWRPPVFLFTDQTEQEFAQKKAGAK